MELCEDPPNQSQKWVVSIASTPIDCVTVPTKQTMAGVWPNIYFRE